jgi:hypothetical protein
MLTWPVLRPKGKIDATESRFRGCCEAGSFDPCDRKARSRTPRMTGGHLPAGHQAGLPAGSAAALWRRLAAKTGNPYVNFML